MKFVVGGRGRLGQAIARQYDGNQLQCLQRPVYDGWADAGGADAAARFFAPWAGSGATVFVTSGLLDPKLAPADHRRVNVQLPLNIIAGASAHGIGVVTFGTVMESLLARHNPYIESKAALGRHVAELAAAGGNVAHIRVHTLFGAGEPSPFMFLGQILTSLRQCTPFNMTLGKQLREYHHVDDEAAAIRAFDAAGVRGVTDLSNGEAVSLRELATTVFAQCSAADLLHVGALAEPLEENYSTVFARHRLLGAQAYRPALPAIVAYLKACLAQPKPE
ncbi:NAD-dependent epimerase/dehydratase family protein [Massilia sp. TWR1-2-2]|uniref:NAD-dependent epimerase/dehydratase family protein n=1 Tax=Massilia sp. TWR1-2-2 TaxID=2804584 RepID=UPI003CF51AA9